MSKNHKRVQLKIIRLNDNINSKKTYFSFRGESNSLIIDDKDSEVNFYLHSWMQKTVKNIKSAYGFELIFSSIEIKSDDQLIVF